MSDDQDGCEWVNVSSGTGLPGQSGPKAVKRLCVLISNRRKISISESGISETPRMMSYLQGRIYSKLFRKKTFRLCIPAQPATT